MITAESLEYFKADLPEFVIEKVPLSWEAVWLGALKIHVAAAALALPGCLVLLSKTALQRAPRLHRWAGRATAAVVLLALVPSGSYLALFAKGRPALERGLSRLRRDRRGHLSCPSTCRA